MERKFKVGDRVKYCNVFIATIVFVSQRVDTIGHYCVEFEDKCIGVCSDDDLTLIEPERKFKEGDEVWHKIEKRKYLFYCDTYVSNDCKLSLGAQTYIRSLSEIEPYTGQDKKQPQFKKDDMVWHKKRQTVYLFEEYLKENKVYLKELSNVIEASESDIEPYNHQDLQLHMENLRGVNKDAAKPTHPYTVILKSGVKIGVSEEAANILIDRRAKFAGEDLEVVLTATIQLSEIYDFTNGEIAAIVPTENVV